MNSLVINEQNRYILLSKTVNMLPTNELKGSKTKEDRKGFSEVPAMAQSLAVPVTVLPENTMF